MDAFVANLSATPDLLGNDRAHLVNSFVSGEMQKVNSRAIYIADDIAQYGSFDDDTFPRVHTYLLNYAADNNSSADEISDELNNLVNVYECCSQSDFEAQISGGGADIKALGKANDR
ncbi:MAG: hypothetical protein ACR652_22705 [Methylocystis sp.]|uniref:hypothetical protein n=1 Tax=Methylocystis sp. TaxID=1911079 RepID=UPI003DA39977